MRLVLMCSWTKALTSESSWLMAREYGLVPSWGRNPKIINKVSNLEMCDLKRFTQHVPAGYKQSNVEQNPGVRM